nr:Chain 2, Polyprotein [Foot-and-mouth disease virus SAT 1]
DKKTEETTLLEDRIVTTSHGTTTSTTQSSVGVTYGYALTDKFLPGPNTNGLETRVEQAERFFKHKLFDWTLDQQFGTTYVLELPTDHKGIYGQLVDSHAYIRNGWDVQVSATATQFNGGCLLVAMVPELCKLDDREKYQLTLFPHQFLNPRTNTTAHIQVPYLGVDRHDQGTRHKAWTLVVMVLAPYTNDQTIGSTKAEVYVNIAPTNVYVAGEKPVKQ